jgi:hypothetical protein
VCCYLCIISCNRPTCSSVILRVDNTDIEILLPIRTIQEEYFLYSNNNTNITSTINTHRAAQPLPDRWRPMLVCMMKGYAPMLRYHNQLHQQLGHEMKPLFPSASSLAIPSQSCALFNTQGTAQAQEVLLCCQTSSPSCAYSTRHHPHCKPFRFRSSHDTQPRPPVEKPQK